MSTDALLHEWVCEIEKTLNLTINQFIVSNMIPSECPECSEIEEVETLTVPPSEHTQSDEWELKIECGNCGYLDWPEA